MRNQFLHTVAIPLIYHAQKV